ncbi:MAG: Transcriptional regulator, TrmB family [Patescibacteria group bacterium]|nr:Transcriptional regulator, TrmB family [Patescibacteria group bacterium]
MFNVRPVAIMLNVSYTYDNTIYMQHLAPQLEALGLGDYESQIYAALLEQSPMGAALIAKKCNLSRSSVYTTLSVLISKGFVGTTHRNEVKQFFAEDLSALQASLDAESKKITERKKILSGLESTIGQLRGMVSIPKITVFEGQEGLKKIYRSMLRESNPNETFHIMRDEFVWQPDWKFIFDKEWHVSIKAIRKEKNIATELLINDSTEEKKHSTYYKSRKGLSVKKMNKKDTLKNFALYILGDTASILSFEQNHLVGIQITNRTIADNMKKLFSVQWKMGKK